MSYATPSASEVLTHDTFIALMQALSRPGLAQALPTAPEAGHEAGLTLIGQTLLDLETSFWTSDAHLADALARTSARPIDVDKADYLFWPALTPADLAQLAQAKQGDMLYPDRSATLVIGGCALGAGTPLRLQGPGIRGELTLRVAGVPAELWAVRERHRRYPVGWDILLVCGNQVVGLPRSTVVVGDKEAY